MPSFFVNGLVEQGGPVMWPMLGLSVTGFVFFVERSLYLHRGQLGVTAFVTGLKNLVEKRRFTEALLLCEETPGPIAAMIKMSLINPYQTVEAHRMALRDAALVEIPLLERRVRTIAAIAKIAPILGFVGTLGALLDGFRLMTQTGTYVDAVLFSDLVARAIVATACGLSISATAYLGHHFLSGRLRSIVNEMEWVANDYLRFIYTELRLHTLEASSGSSGSAYPDLEQTAILSE